MHIIHESQVQESLSTPNIHIERLVVVVCILLSRDFKNPLTLI